MNIASEENPISDQRSDPHKKSKGDFILAIDFGGTKVALATADFAGNLRPALVEKSADLRRNRDLILACYLVVDARKN